MPITVLNICEDAAQEIGVYQPGETLSDTDSAKFLNLLRRLLNYWNADRRAVYATKFQTFTLVPNLTPHTIGPTGAWVTTQRPVSVDGATLVLTPSTPPVNTPIKLRDNQWWLSLTVPTLTSTYPTDLYYQPDWPDGKLFFWPVPTFAYDVTLMTRVVLDDTLTLTDTFSLPPGYQQAVTLSLAEVAQRPYSRPSDPVLLRDASLARMVVFGNNDQIPNLTTLDTGMEPQKNAGSRADFNWLNGSVV